jgi:xanthine dehydrogenase accessory factor
MYEVIEKSLIELEQGKKIVLATVVNTKGSTPQKIGSKLLIREDGSTVGTLGGGCVEGDLWFESKTMLEENTPEESRYREYTLNQELAEEEGLVCGGTMFFLLDKLEPNKSNIEYLRTLQNSLNGKEGGKSLITLVDSTNNKIMTGTKKIFDFDQTSNIKNDEIFADPNQIEDVINNRQNKCVKLEDGNEWYVEMYTTPSTLLICGGGHIANSLAPLAHKLNFNVWITDDRKEFANSNRFPNAERIVNDLPENALKSLPVTENTYIIIATRGHRYDLVATQAAVSTNAKYIGLLGSVRKAILVSEDLLKNGIPEDKVKAIRSPVGLDLRGRSPDEIAVSIIAEMLMIREGGTGLPMAMPENIWEKITNKINNLVTNDKVK